MKIQELSIDLETYSSIDISKSGVYKYAESQDFEILLFGYSINHGEVHVIDIASGENIPEEIFLALTDDSITKWAFNASFERICISNWLKRHHPEQLKNHKYLSPDSWKCTMIWSAYMGLPLSLESVGNVLNLEDQKLKEGKELIRYFCKPCKPTKVNSGRIRNLPFHAPEKWTRFKQYNKRDVEAELAIKQRLTSFPVPDFIWKEYHLDQQINDRGIALDMRLVENAIAIDNHSKNLLSQKMRQLTNLENPNSVQQMKKWLSNHGVETDSLGKKTVASLLETTSDNIQQVLSLRLMLSKSSVKKYQAMQNAACADSRARGMFQFYGANRSGRWAGRLIQLQNLPQNHMPDLAEARGLIRSGDFESTELLYDDIPDTLSQLIRTAFIPKTGYKFIVADFSAIEARVLAHLAGEHWREKVFSEGGDIYCASASQMFHVPVEKHGVNSHLRQKGKIAELALGYGGSVGALKSMGALDMGIEETELQLLVDSWRKANPKITAFWWDIDHAVKEVVNKSKDITTVSGIRFLLKSKTLFIELPSGRRLAYIRPKPGISKFGTQSITYEGIGTTKKWERIESYGPKFVENIVQAISRDILANALSHLRNYDIVGHVHDEIIIECPRSTNLETICDQMARPPVWLPNILLRADGYETDFYKKD